MSPTVATSGSMAIKNTFIHLDESLIDPDAELTLPLKSVSAPSITTGSSMLELCMSPTSYTSKDDVSQTPKCLRFGFGDGSDTEAGSNEISPTSSGSIQLPLATLSRDSFVYTIKNTFVHVGGSGPDDSDLCLPPKNASAPAMTFSSVRDPLSPANSDIASHELPSATEYAPTIPATPLDDDFPRCTISFSLPAASENANLTRAQSAKPLPSIGSATHAIGQCKPCAWYWKEESCHWGAECQHCHLCPMGELRSRKKERRAEAKALKREAAAVAAALADTTMGSQRGDQSVM